MNVPTVLSTTPTMLVSKLAQRTAVVTESPPAVSAFACARTVSPWNAVSATLMEIAIT